MTERQVNGNMTRNMDIDAAIAHAREVAKEQKSKYDKCPTRTRYNCEMCFHDPKCTECAEEHEQRAEWLEELKAFQENKWTDIYIKRGYNKAIDDFVNQFNVIVDEKCGTDTNNYFRKIVKEVAEQLKAGEQNE